MKTTGLKRLLWRAAVIALLVLAIKVMYPTTTPTDTPAQPVTTTLDCENVPDDGQQHPCMFNGKLAPPLPMTVAQKQGQNTDGTCWWLLLTSVREPNTGTRLCIPQTTYDNYQVGGTYYLFDLDLTDQK